MNNCKLCNFKNPKTTATAIVMKDQKVLVVKRNQEPFKDCWDFVGGYVNDGETIEQAMVREIKEELNIDCEIKYISKVTSIDTYEDFTYPTLNYFYLVKLSGPIELNNENTEFAWVPLGDFQDIAFDSNKKILAYIKDKFLINLERVKYLINQLDPSAVVDEQCLYKAMIDGYVSKIFDGDKLIGMGWIFARQTALRKQAVVEDMIVDPIYRGQGLGEKILLDLLAWAKRIGCDTVELTTNPKRTAANNLYKKVGFWLHETNHYLYNIK